MAGEKAPEPRPLQVPLPASAGWEADESFETTELGYCLVTGGAGFLGRHLAYELISRGHRVRVFDRKSIDYSHERLDFVRGDVCQFEDVRKACEGIDTVFHTAAVLEFLGFATRAQREESFAVNVRGVEHVVRACREAGVARLIHTSSNNVTLDDPVIDGDESLPYAANPKDLYTKTKILGEKIALAANGQDGLLSCAIRPGGIYGPGETLVFPRVVEECASGKYVALIGDGTAMSDNTFIDNLVDGEIEAARHLVPGSPLGGQAYYITDGVPINYFDFFRPLVEGLGFEHPKRRIPAAPLHAFLTLWEFLHAKIKIPRPMLTPMELRKIVVSHYNRIDKARRDFGWVPKVSMDDAMARCLEHCRELLAEREAVDRPHWGWWVSILGGMTLLGTLALSPGAHALWSRAVTSWTPRWLLAGVFVSAVLLHVYKGMKAVRMAERADLRRTSMGWGWQTFALGFASLRMLEARIEGRRDDETEGGRKSAEFPALREWGFPNVRWLLALITTCHRFVYDASDGLIGAHFLGKRFLLLIQEGRRTGLERVTPLLYVDHEGCWIVVASNAGDDRAPDWWLNLKSRPEARIQVGRRRLAVAARRATAEECARLWPKLNGAYRYFEAYQQRTSREIPVVILEPSAGGRRAQDPLLA